MGGQVIGGLVWLSSARWLLRLSGVLAVVVLARTLGPVAYAVVAATMVLEGLLRIGQTLGLQSSVIQRKELPDRRYIDVAWTYDTVLTKVVATIVIFLLAPVFSRVFHLPELTAIVRAMAFIPFLQIFENAAMVSLTRSLDYKKRFLLETSKTLGGFVVLVPLLFILHNAWAIVFSYLAGTAVRAAMSYVVYPHLPRLNVSWSIARELLPFGVWVMSLQALRLLRRQLDKLVLGAILGPAPLSYLQVGGRVSNVVYSDLQETLSRVLFPVYARVQDDAERLKRGFLSTLETVLLFAIPGCAVLWLLSPLIVRVVFGPEWMPAAMVTQILVLAGLLATITSVSEPLFRGAGRPKYEFAVAGAFVALEIPVLVVFTRIWGLNGTAWGVVVSHAFEIPLMFILLRRVLALRARECARRAAFPLAAAAVLGFALWAALAILAPLQPFIQLGVAGILALVLAFALGFIGSRVFKVEGIDLLVRRVGSFVQGSRRRAPKRAQEPTIPP